MSPIEQHQSDVHARLNAGLSFAESVHIHLWRPRTKEQSTQLESAYAKAMAGQLDKNGVYGLAVFAMMPTLKNNTPDAPGPDFDVTTVARIIEVPRANMLSTGTGISAEEAAIEIAGLCHHFVAGGRFGAWSVKELTPLDEEQVASGLIQYDVIIESRFSLDVGGRCAHVQMSGTSSPLTLTCGTSGATIYFTTDGSFPWSGNEAAYVYGSALTMEAGTILRAAAFKDGLLPSQITEKTIV